MGYSSLDFMTPGFWFAYAHFFVPACHPIRRNEEQGELTLQKKSGSCPIPVPMQQNIVFRIIVLNYFFPTLYMANKTRRSNLGY